MLYHPSWGSVSGNSRRENRWMTMGVRSGTSPSWDQLAVTASHDHILPPSPPFLSDLLARPRGLALYAGEGDYRAPAISDCRLILYKARPEICGRGSCICWKLFIFSSPRTRASRLLRYKSRTHVQVIKSRVWSDRTADWSSTKIVVADATFDLVLRRHMMLQQVLSATHKILLPSSIPDQRGGSWSGSFRSKVYSSRGDGVAGYGIRCLVFFRRRSWTIGAPGIDEAGTVRRAAA